MKTVFIVDDSEASLVAVKAALEGTYRTFTMSSASRMFKLAERIMPDLILLDVDMPEMDGLQTLLVLKADKRLSGIPVVILTGEHDPQVEMQGFEMGAVDFINKPSSPSVLTKRIDMHIQTDSLIKKSLQAVRDIHNATMSVIADLVEGRDKVTGGHIARTQRYLELLLGECISKGIYESEIANWDTDLLLPSAQLHDVGKIVISDLVLNKPGKLTEDEFNSIKKHCDVGETIIGRIMSNAKDNGFLLHARKFAGSHHEKWDGSGYPRGLRGKDIPLEGRIMAIVDVYDAICSERPYKKPLSHEEAVDIIKKSSGSHFDPVIVEAFLDVAEYFWVESVSAKSDGM